MLKENDVVFFVDLDNGKMIEGLIDHNDNGRLKELLIKFNDNNYFKRYVRRELVGRTESEAQALFGTWKENFQEELVTNNKWINDLFNSWLAHECEYEFKEGQKIMKSVILEKLGILID